MLATIVSKAQITLDDVDKESTFINTLPGTTAPLRLHFCKPDSISILGDYSQQPSSDSPMCIDMLLVLNPVLSSFPLNRSPAAQLRVQRLPELVLPEQALALPGRAVPAPFRGVSLPFPPLRLAPRRLRQAAAPARAPGLALRPPLLPPPPPRPPALYLPRGKARSRQDQRPPPRAENRGTHLVLQRHRARGPPVSPLRRLASPRRRPRARPPNRGTARPGRGNGEPSRVAMDNRGGTGPPFRRFRRVGAAGGAGGNRGNRGNAVPVANVRRVSRLSG